MDWWLSSIVQKMLDRKNQEISDLQYELARVCKVTCFLYYIHTKFKPKHCEFMNAYKTVELQNSRVVEILNYTPISPKFLHK